MSTIKKIHPHVNITTSVLEKPSLSVNNNSTALYAVFEADKGLDNQIIKINTIEEFIEEYGDFNPKKYGQAHLNIYQWLMNGGAVYANRVLPDNAKHAHVFMNLHVKGKDETNDIDGNLTNIETIRPVISYNGVNNISEVQLLDELKYEKETADGYKIYPVLVAYSKARGKHYNKLGLKFEVNTKQQNNYVYPIYNVSVTERRNNIDRVVEGPFLVSLNPDATRTDGASLFIENVINNNSKYLTVEYNHDKMEELFELSEESVTEGQKALTADSDFIFGTQRKDDLSYGINFITDGTDEEAVSLAGLSFDTEEVVSAIEASIAQLHNYLPTLQLTEGKSFDITVNSEKELITNSELFTRQMFENDNSSYINDVKWVSLQRDNNNIEKFYPIISTQSGVSKINYSIASPEYILNDIQSRIDHSRDIELANRLLESVADITGSANGSDSAAVNTTMVKYWKKLYRQVLKSKTKWENFHRDVQINIAELNLLKDNADRISKEHRLETINEVFNVTGVIEHAIDERIADYVADGTSRFDGATYESIRNDIITGNITSNDALSVDTLSAKLLACEETVMLTSAFNKNIELLINDLINLNNRFADLIKPKTANVFTTRTETVTDEKNLTDFYAGILVEEMFLGFPERAKEGSKKIPNNTNITVTVNVSFDAFTDTLKKLEEEKSKAYKKLTETNTLLDPEAIISINKGSNGVIKKADREYETNLMYQKAFSTDIIKAKEYPANVILDANYNATVKRYIMELVNTNRTDIMAYMDCGLENDSVKSTIDYVTNMYGIYATENIAVYGQHIVVYDVFTKKDVKVTPTYALASMIPSNDIKNGLHTTVSGLRRGILQGIKGLSFNPNDDEQEELYLAKVNYIEKTRSNYKFESQQTTRTTNDALNKINNTRIIKKLRTQIKDICEPFIHEFNDKQTLSILEKNINNYLQFWKNNRSCEIAEAKVYADDLSKSMGIARVKISIKFTGVIDIIDVEIEVQ